MKSKPKARSPDPDLLASPSDGKLGALLGAMSQSAQEEVVKDVQRRVERMVFRSFLTLSYAIAKGLADSVVLSIADGEPCVDAVTPDPENPEEPQVVRFKAVTHIKALYDASHGYHTKLILMHNDHANCQDYLDALKQLEEQQAPKAVQSIIAVSGN